MRELKFKLIAWLMRGYNHLLVAGKGNEGFVLAMADEESKKQLKGILLAAMKDDKDTIRDIVLGVAEDYLKPLEIESRNFINKIK